MSELDVTELAKSLERTSANLDRLIKAKGQEVGAALGKTYAKAADDRIRENAVEMQRLQDLVAEMQRQREPLERAADRAQRLAGAIRKAKYAGEETISVKVLMDILDAPAAAPEGMTP